MEFLQSFLGSHFAGNQWWRREIRLLFTLFFHHEWLPTRIKKMTEKREIRTKKINNEPLVANSC